MVSPGKLARRCEVSEICHTRYPWQAVISLICPDRGENVENGSRHFAIGGRPSKRLCDAVQDLASDTVMKEENIFNATGIKQHTIKSHIPDTNPSQLAGLVT